MRRVGLAWDTSEVVAPISAPAAQPEAQGRVEEPVLDAGADQDEEDAATTKDGLQSCFFWG